MKITKSLLKRIMKEEMDIYDLDPEATGDLSREQGLGKGWRVHPAPDHPDHIAGKHGPRKDMTYGGGFLDAEEEEAAKIPFEAGSLQRLARSALKFGYNSDSFLKLSRIAGGDDAMAQTAKALLDGVEEELIRLNKEKALKRKSEKIKNLKNKASKNPDAEFYIKESHKIKITKSQLKRIIKEELESILEKDEPYYGHLGDENDLRGNVAKYIAEAEKKIKKVNLFLKNAKMQGKSHKFIAKMLNGAGNNAMHARNDLEKAWRSSSMMSKTDKR